MKNVYVVILSEFGVAPVVLGVFTTLEKALKLKEKYENEVGDFFRPVIYEVPLNGVVTSGKLKYWSMSVTTEGIKGEEKEIDLDKIWTKKKPIQLTPEQQKKLERISETENIEEAKKRFEEFVKSVDPEKWKEWKRKYKEFKRKIKF